LKTPLPANVNVRRLVMTKLSISTDADSRGLSGLQARDHRYFNLDALFGRIERFEARRNRGRTGAVTSPPQRLDAKLLEEGEDFEAAWAYEVATLIAAKRLNTPEAAAMARSARAATARVAARIEAARAITLDGLKVKARAILWRRNGEPLGTIGPSQRTCYHSPAPEAGVARPVTV
jgi:hypothetical protein